MKRDDYAATVRRVANRAQEEKARLRAKAPGLAAFVDELRAEGIDARLKYVRFADGEEKGIPFERQPPAEPIKNAEVIQRLKDEFLANKERRRGKSSDR